MSNSNLKSFDNFYADLAQSAYHGRPIRFPYDSQKRNDREKLDSGESLFFDFSKNKKYEQDVTNPDTGKIETVTKEVIGGGQDLPHGGKVYLQPDPTLHIERDIDLPVVDDDSELVKKTKSMVGAGDYYKGLMTDEKAGFNSYFLTDTPTLDKTTSATYMTIRGSDGLNIDKVQSEGLKALNLNDWIDNDAYFALYNERIPQALLATEAMKARIQEMSKKAPNAKMNVTAHSLGTMVSAQGLAGLSSSELDKIGNVVLFDGPDTRKSLKKMKVSKEVYDKLDQKITYYVNPFDIVSMLNRENTIYNLENPDQKAKEKGLGTVRVMVPLNYTVFHNMDDSAHDFGVMQMSASGEMLVASGDYHPELLVAGEKLARLISETMADLRELGVDDDVALNVLKAIMTKDMVSRAAFGYALYQKFEIEYNEIVKVARQESIAWDRKAIADYKKQLAAGISDGTKRIEVQTKLIQTASQLASLEVEDSTNHLTSLLDEAKEKVQQEVNDGIETAYSKATYLSSSEVDMLLMDFNFETFWKEGTYDASVTEANNFKASIDQLSVTMNRAVAQFQEADSIGAETFNELLEDTKRVWR